MVRWTKGEEGERTGGGRQKAGRDGNCFDATRRRERKRRRGQGRCKNRGRPKGVHVMQVRTWCGPVWHGKVGMGWQLRWSTEMWGIRYLRLGPRSTELPSNLYFAHKSLAACHCPDLGHFHGPRALDWEVVNEMRTLLIDDTSTLEEQQMQLSDFPRIYQRGLQATYFTWPAGVPFRHLLLPQHNWLSGAGAQECSSYKKALEAHSFQPPTTGLRLRVPTWKWQARLLLFLLRACTLSMSVASLSGATLPHPFQADGWELHPRELRPVATYPQAALSFLTTPFAASLYCLLRPSRRGISLPHRYT